MSSSSTSGYIRYLAAKQGLDDRSLNRQVWDCLVRAVQGRPAAAPLRVLEVGCGIGTMVERLLDWGLLTRAHYTGIDVEAEFIREARRRLRHYAEAKWPGSVVEDSGAITFATPGQEVRVSLEVADLADFLDREQGRAAFDLLVAHAFLDLVDLPATLPRLLALLPPGGLFYFTLNFDGATILEPPIDPDLDRRIIARYHETMDTRRVRGQPAGSSVTGRRLLRHLKEGGVTVAAAGSSDWLVFPGPAGYPGDEAYFLHFIIDTIAQALLGHPEPDPEPFRAWIARRHAQIEAAELVYIAHQVDVMGYI
ncbi:MAG: class I SAM-dependent methyltransferase [Desulfobaccales bacterium]